MAPLSDDQATVYTVAEFLARADGPFHINVKTARALGRIFEWHLNLDSDQGGDNEVILAAAKTFDVESDCDDVADELDALRAQVKGLTDALAKHPTGILLTARDLSNAEMRDLKRRWIAAQGQPPERWWMRRRPGRRRR